MSSAGDEAVDLVGMAGITLDPWEEFVLRESLGERKDGRWAAFEVGVVCPRQNGKNEILLARELVGLFLLGERLIQHSAHMFDTSLEAFRRLLAVIEDNSKFHRRIKPRGVKYSHGEEGLELRGGQRIRFRTRGGKTGGGRGFTGDLLMLDEAMDISERAHGDMLPTLSARSVVGDPQVWYAASAVDQWIHENGVVLARVRERALGGEDPSLAYFEWSIDGSNPDKIGDRAEELAAWAEANPGLGIRISAEHIAREHRSMDPRTFAVERLGVGDWPRTDRLTNQVFEEEAWKALRDLRSAPRDPICFAFDVPPDRSSASIAVAGGREDGLSHVEVVDRRRGTGWVIRRLAELVGEHSPAAVICDAAGPAGSLIKDIEEELAIEVITPDAREYTQACGGFYDAFDQQILRHLDQPELNAAAMGAAQRPLGDSWAWSRKSSVVDISPLVAGTLALWGIETQNGESVYQDRDLLVLE